MGSEGLGSLAGVPLESAALQLAQAARSEAEAGHEGSLFGALLQVRRGPHLREHVETLLLKLGQYRQGPFDLREAFAFIAAMHAQDLLILTKEILAKALSISPVDLRRKVLTPLGDEAAIATTGRHVFTRHRAIALAALELLTDRFSVDLDNLYERLEAAALFEGLGGTFVPSFDKWRYLGGHFFSQGDPVLGIKLGRMALAAEPGNPYLVNKLSKMYRDSGDPDAAIGIFRNTTPVHPRRSYFLEWGVAEMAVGNLGVAARLVGFSLSDKAEYQPPDLDQALMSLKCLGSIFARLSESYGAAEFSTARGAAEELVTRASQVQESTGGRTGSPSTAQTGPLIEQLRSGLQLAHAQSERAPISEIVEDGDRMTFEHLRRLLN
jgi:hypothetical protein